MLRTAILSILLLSLFLGCLLPGIDGGFLLCIAGGPEGHVAIERGPCGVSGPVALPDMDTLTPTAVPHGTGESCLDISLEKAASVRLAPSAPAVPPSAPAVLHPLPAVVDAPAAVAPPVPPPGMRTPVRLRI